LSDPLDTTTVDQEAPGPRQSRFSPVPFVEVLHHPVPSHWGMVSPPGALTEGAPLALGRGTPLVDPWAPSAPRALGDPCLSRALATVGWNGRAFEVMLHSDRRGVRYVDPRGRSLPGASAERTVLPPGSRLVVEDRLVLSLEHRISPVDWHAWYRERFPAEAEEDASPESPLDLVGETDAIWRLRRMILSLPSGPHDVFLEGETGAGKELVAAAVHRRMRGGAAPYVTVNCASIPGTLFESELFGHVGGAFSGASRDGRRGAFQEADHGTLFLDEIAELPLDVQAKLNRAIENRVVTAVGARHTAPTAVDVLMIYATWQDLSSLVRDGRFRADLMNRCQRLHLTVPPLSERVNDIPRLIRHLLQRLRDRSLVEPRTGQWTLSSRRLDDLFTDPGRRRPAIEQPVVLRLLEWSYADGNVRLLNNLVQRAAFAYLSGTAFELVEVGPEEVASVPFPAEEAPRTARQAPESIPLETWRAAYTELGSVRRVAQRFDCSVGTADKYLRLAGVSMGAPNLRGVTRRGDRT
jgi:DNA-binding NtrC family response regulator